MIAQDRYTVLSKDRGLQFADVREACVDLHTIWLGLSINEVSPGRLEEIESHRLAMPAAAGMPGIHFEILTFALANLDFL